VLDEDGNDVGPKRTQPTSCPTRFEAAAGEETGDLGQHAWLGLSEDVFRVRRDRRGSAGVISDAERPPTRSRADHRGRPRVATGPRRPATTPRPAAATTLGRRPASSPDGASVSWDYRRHGRR
jgi:hypothetical protein